MASVFCHGMLTQKDPFAVLFSVQKPYSTGAKTESNTGTESNTDPTKD